LKLSDCTSLLGKDVDIMPSPSVLYHDRRRQGPRVVSRLMPSTMQRRHRLAARSKIALTQVESLKRFNGSSEALTFLTLPWFVLPPVLPPNSKLLEHRMRVRHKNVQQVREVSLSPASATCPRTPPWIIHHDVQV
jgi:hypothetical protein